MADDEGIITGAWEPRLRVDEELEFFTELALHETERWIQAVTRNKFRYPDDPRKSLENGILLCDLLNCLKPKCIKKVNKLPTPIAGLDNQHVFLEACATHFNLKDSQLFNYCDLEDLSTRAISDSEDQLKYETDRRLRNVAITIFWLGKAAREFYDGPHLDLTAFSDLVNHQVAPHETSPPVSHFREEESDSATESQTSEGTPGLPACFPTVLRHERQPSSDSVDHSSAYGSYRSDPKSSQSSGNLGPEEDTQRTGDTSYDSLSLEDPILRDSGIHDPVVTPEAYNMPVRHDDSRRHSSYTKPSEIRYSATFDSVYDGSDSDSMKRDGDQYQSTPSLNSDPDSRTHFNRSRFGSQEGINTRSDSIDSLDYNRRAGSDHSRQSSGSGDYQVSRPSYRRTSSSSPKPSANPLQFIRQDKENPLVEHARDVVEVMEKQKKEKVMMQSGEDDWQSNLSAWKSKMRRKSAATYTRAMEADEVLKKEEVDQGAAGGRRNKTFKEMMQERERRKSGNFNIYPYGEDAEKEATMTKDKEPEPTSTKQVLSAQTEDTDEFGYIRRKKRIETKDDKLSKLRGASVDDKSKPDKFSKWKMLEKESFEGKVENNDKASKWQTQQSKSLDSGDKFSKWKALETKNSNDKFSRWRQREKDTGTEFEKESSPAFKSEIPKHDRFSKWRQSENNNDEVFRPEQRSQGRQTGEEVWRGRSTELERTETKQMNENNRENNSQQWKQRAATREDTPPRTETVNTQRAAFGSHSNTFTSMRGSFESKNDEDVPPSSAQHHQGALQNTPPYRRRVGAVDQPPAGLIQNYVKEHALRDASPASRVDEERGSLPRSNRMSAEAEEERGAGRSKVYSVPQVQQDENKKTYVKKTVKINQKPGNPRGFGFTVMGGKEEGSRLTVGKVSIGSAADVCELLAGDEIVAVNGADVGGHYRESVVHVVNQAAQIGQLELRICRFITTGCDDEDLFDGRDDRSISPIDVSFQKEERAELESLEQEEAKEDERYEDREEEDEDDDAPPPIPSEPPPIPNWDTFPSEGLPDEAFKDVLPDNSVLASDRAVSPDKPRTRPAESLEKRNPALEALDATMRIRTEALRRRSEYLGVELEEMQEYQKLKAERDREAQRIMEREQEESKMMQKELQAKRDAIKERLKAMKREQLVSSETEHTGHPLAAQSRETEHTGHPLAAQSRETERMGRHLTAQQSKATDVLWQQIEAPTRDTDNTTFGTGTFGFKPEYDLEKAEREIIENLEREEKSKVLPRWQHSQDTSAKESGLKPWQTYDTLEQSPRHSSTMEARVRKDMETTLNSAPQTEKPVRSSMRFFDFEADRKRMEEWDQVHEEERQEQFRRGTEELQRKYKEEKRIGELAIEQKNQQEALLLEKELAHQRELEKMQQQQQEERERQRALEEKARRQQEEDERRRKQQEEVRRQREEERRRKQEEEEEWRREKEEEVQRRKREKEEERHRRDDAEHARNRQREWEAEGRRRLEEAELQQKLQRQKHQIERHQPASPTRPRGDYAFQFSVKNPPTHKSPWQQDAKVEKDEAVRVAEERAALRAEEQRLRQLEEERRQREEREASQLKEREDQLRSMEERIKREAEALKAERDRLLQEKHQRHQAWNLQTDKQYQEYPQEESTSGGYPYAPTEAPVSQLNDYASPLQVDVGKQPSYTTGEVHMELSGNKPDYSKPEMQPGYGYQELQYALKGARDHSPPEKDDRSRPQFKVEIRTDPDRRIVIDRGSSSSPHRETAYYSPEISRSTSESSLRPPFVQNRPPLTRNDPTKISIPPSSTPDLVTRREVIDLNKRPGAYQPQVSPQYGMPQTTRSMDEITVKRPTLDWNKRTTHPEQPHQYSQSIDGSDTTRDMSVRLNQRPTGPRPDDYWMRESPHPSPRGTSRDERLSPRKSWQEEAMMPDVAYQPQSDSNQVSSRRSLHNLGATPKQRIISGNEWIVSEDERKHQERQQRLNRHADIMKQHVPHTSDHWLVEEAERRRVADRAGQDRPANLQSRPTHMGGSAGYWNNGEPGPYHDGSHDTDSQSVISQRSYDQGEGPPRVQAVLYRSPTHIMEHTEVPEQDRSRPPRPIPEAIKQTLIQRVTSPKQSSNRSPSSSQGPPSPNFQYSGYGAQPHYQGPVYAKTVQYNPSSQSPFPQSSYPQQAYDDSPPFHYPQSVPYTDSAQYQLSSQYVPTDPTPADHHQALPPVPPTKPPRVHVQSGSSNQSSGGTRAEAVVSVSGRQQCAHCDDELDWNGKMPRMNAWHT